MSCSTSGLPVHHQLLESTQTHVHRVDDATQPFHPLFPLLLLPSIFPNIRVFSNESALCIRWPNICSFSFSICPSNKHPKLISFRMGWLDLLAVQGALKSLLQHHSSKASMFLCVAFFIVQLSHHVLNVCILVSFEMDLCVWVWLWVACMLMLRVMFLPCWRICVVCLALELIGSWVVAGFSVGMEAFG